MSPSFSNAPNPTVASDWRALADEAWHYWEPLRLLYNAVLSLIAVAYVEMTWPHFKPAFQINSVLPLLVLVMAANVCYSAAYLPELVIQLTPWREWWRRKRWVLWLVGMALAATLEYYWIADEIYPSVR